MSDPSRPNVNHQIDIEQLKQTRPIQTCMPIATYTDPVPGETYVEPSTSRLLKVDERVLLPLALTPQEIHIQRLTPRTYWIWVNVYTVTLYVGNTGLLLIDAPDVLPIPQFLEAIKQVSPLPLTTLVYTHAHVDHVGSTGRLQDALKQQGMDLRIIASEQCVREIKRYKNSVRMPTEVVPSTRNTFTFEGHIFKHVTPSDWAHSGADSYIITPDGVAMIVDFFYPGYLPLAEVSGVQNMTGYIEALRHLSGEDWQYANLGHANVGYKKDLSQTLEYLEDLYNAAYEIWPGFAPEGLVPFYAGNHVGVMIRNLFDMAVQQMALSVKDKWSHLPHWEVARDHAAKVLWDFSLNYDYTSAREIGDKLRAMPDFDPIPCSKSGDEAKGCGCGGHS